MNIKDLPTHDKDGRPILTLKDIREAVENGTAEEDPGIQRALKEISAIRQTGLDFFKKELERATSFKMPTPSIPPRPLTGEEMAQLLEREREAGSPMNVWTKVGIIAGVIATIVSVVALIISWLAYVASSRSSS